MRILTPIKKTMPKKPASSRRIKTRNADKSLEQLKRELIAIDALLKMKNSRRQRLIIEAARRNRISRIDILTRQKRAS